ncbi:FAD-binding domain-containing protein [Canariomyces notabilis]|uniref:FAD-binding domain-containing protein n=1 Tax=Canariomyces notabilis TaxID=2074819 RepID=A0AAN6QE35_9PEZI|nr:FAD-binding domain-containing protein [Canariomyces arenarius]
MSRLFLTALILGLSLCGSANQCCSLLESQHPDLVFQPGTPRYLEEASQSYWSTTARLTPSCVFTPSSAELVSQAVKFFEQKNCTFAIRSGGHSPSQGWANIDDGVLLATTNLSSKSIHDGYASFGSGLRWGSVYEFLAPYNLVAIGGRSASVGMAGLVLGGGVSHFTPKHGLACDNVKGFQVVTAKGQILEVNASSHADLFEAMKGGQNIFGVVTRFDLYTYPSPKLHSVSARLNMTYFDRIADEYDNFARMGSTAEGAEDLELSLITYWAAIFGDPFIEVGFLSMAEEERTWVTDPDTTDLRLPHPLDGFDGFPYTNVSEKWGTMSERASGPKLPALRYDLRTMTFQSNANMMKGIKKIFEEEFAALLDMEGFAGIVEWQLVTNNALEQGVKMGGNILGLEGFGSVVFFAMANSWSDASYDEAAYTAGRRVVERGEALAKELGVHLPYIYANYAAADQDVLSSYGAKNVAKLKRLRRKYDPASILHKLVPGGLSGMLPSGGTCKH